MCVNTVSECVSELQTQADGHAQIKPPLRHNYPGFKLNDNPLKEKERETKTLTETDSQRKAG